MTNIDYTKCLGYLYPNVEWSITDNDFATLQWFSDTQKPTLQELQNVWEDVVASDEAEKQAKENAKSAAQAKLAALGLTADDLTALGLGGN